LPIEAVIINKPAALFEVINLKIGDTIIMDQKYDEDVVVRSGNIALFKGHIGKVDDKVAVSLKTFIEE
jgi:flagellar motor switch protein FliM